MEREIAWEVKQRKMLPERKAEKVSQGRWFCQSRFAKVIYWLCREKP